MKYLSAPWRWNFIAGLKNDNGCIFCQALSKSDEEALICFRGDNFFVILNKYPYSTGHLMVVPYAHCPSPEKLPAGELAEMWQLTNQVLEILKKEFHPDGFNIGMNIGKVAGAGVKDHFHQHIVPRWQGDANFMAIIGETRVLSYDQKKVFNVIASALKK